MSEERFDRIEHKFADVDQRFDRIEAHLEHLHQRVGILHEDVLSRFAAIPDPTSRLEAKIDRAVAELTEVIGRRLDPLELAVRQHSKEIDQLKRRRR